MRSRIRLTDDEIRWLLKAHRERCTAILACPQLTRAGQRLQEEALSHHEQRIDLLRTVESDRRHVLIAEG